MISEYLDNVRDLLKHRRRMCSFQTSEGEQS